MYLIGFPIWVLLWRQSFPIVEVRFKNGKKDFYRNSENLDVITGDAVIVDVPNGHHLGYISLARGVGASANAEEENS